MREIIQYHFYLNNIIFLRINFGEHYLYKLNVQIVGTLLSDWERDYCVKSFLGSEQVLRHHVYYSYLQILINLNVHRHYIVERFWEFVLLFLVMLVDEVPQQSSVQVVFDKAKHIFWERLNLLLILLYQFFMFNWNNFIMKLLFGKFSSVFSSLLISIVVTGSEVREIPKNFHNTLLTNAWISLSYQNINSIQAREIEFIATFVSEGYCGFF